MKIGELEFKPINLEKHGSICVNFRKNAFIDSFGSAELFYGTDGKGAEKYLEDNKRRLQDDPEACVHVWKDDEIIGQIELERWFKDSSVGYIDLFYVVARYRGKGYADIFEEYAESYFKKIGCKRMRLSVSIKNLRAVNFYKKHGWKDCGPRENFPEVHYMEKYI